MAKKRICIIGGTLLLFGACALYGQSATEALSKMAYFSTSTLQIVDAELRSFEGVTEARPREIRLYIDRSTPELKLLATVTAPSFLRNLKFLRTGSGNQSTIWVKTSKGVRRLAGNASSEELFQSDFTTSDFNLTSLTWGHQADGDTDTLFCFVASQGLEFGAVSAKLFVRKSDNLIEQCSYFDIKGSVIRTYKVVQWRNDEKGSYPVQIKLDNVKMNRYSSLELRGIESPKSLPAGTFLPGAL